MGEDYDAVVVGELHGNADIGEKEYRLVLQEQPEYLLLEGLDQYDADDLDPLLERGAAFETVQDVNAFLNGRYDERVDVSVSQDTQVYDMTWEEREAIVTDIDAQRNEAEGAYDASLRDIQEFYEQVQMWQQSLFRQQRPVWTAASGLREHGVYMGLAGCDVDKRPTIKELVDAADREEREAILERDVLDTWEQREQEMADRIVEYVDRSDTDRPVVAVVGALHIWDGNDVIPRLKDKGVTPRVKQFGPSTREELAAHKQNSAAYTDYILSEQGVQDMLEHRDYLDALEPL